MDTQWEELRCFCGSGEFIVMAQVRWRQSGGIVNQSKGYRCANCRKIAPIDRMINELKQRQAERKIEELKEEANAFAPRDQVPIQEGNQANTGLHAG